MDKGSSLNRSKVDVHTGIKSAAFSIMGPTPVHNYKHSKNDSSFGAAQNSTAIDDSSGGGGGIDSSSSPYQSRF